MDASLRAEIEQVERMTIEERIVAALSIPARFSWLTSAESAISGSQGPVKKNHRKAEFWSVPMKDGDQWSRPTYRFWRGADQLFFEGVNFTGMLEFTPLQSRLLFKKPTSPEAVAPGFLLLESPSQTAVLILGGDAPVSISFEQKKIDQVPLGHDPDWSDKYFFECGAWIGDRLVIQTEDHKAIFSEDLKLLASFKNTFDVRMRFHLDRKVFFEGYSGSCVVDLDSLTEESLDECSFVSCEKLAGKGNTF